jgi:4'-phosphopantetheinyl transferase
MSLDCAMEQVARSLTSERPWITPQQLPPLAALKDLHVWRVALDRPESFLAGLKKLLAPDEQRRADRFLVESARSRFLASHGALRIVLGAYVGREPRELSFVLSDKGKPAFSAETSTKRLCFNLSHSGDFALIALAAGREVGVDIERVQDRPDMYQPQNSFLAPGEQVRLNELAPSQRRDFFYRVWTCKEAVLKATGQGIASGLRSPDLSLNLTQAQARAGFVVEHNGGCWRVYELEPAPGYASAVAIEAGIGEIST